MSFMRKQMFVLGPAHVERIKAIIATKGLCVAAERLGSSVHTIERAIGGLNLNPGTKALLEQKIAERDKKGKTP